MQAQDKYRCYFHKISILNVKYVQNLFWTFSQVNTPSSILGTVLRLYCIKHEKFVTLYLNLFLTHATDDRCVPYKVREPEH